MRIDELPRSENIEDRRGARIRRGGGIGIGTLVVLALVAWAFGIDPRLLIGGAEILTGGQQSQPPSYSDTARPGKAPSDEMKEFVAAVLGSTEVQWKELFAQANSRYQPPMLVMFSGATSSACGFAQAAMGPFYCPNDRQVYLDTAFFEDLQRRFGACDPGKACQFSQAYVIAHEVGHHVQNSARYFAATATDAAGAGPGGCEPSAGDGRAASGLLRRRVGKPFATTVEIPRSWRRRSGVANGLRDRRRSAAAAVARLCGARRVYAWLVAAAHALVQHRAEIRRCRKLRHVQRGAALAEPS